MDNEKRETQLVFMSAVHLLITGPLASQKADMDDIVEWLEEVADKYRDEMKKNDDKILKANDK